MPDSIVYSDAKPSYNALDVSSFRHLRVLGLVEAGVVPKHHPAGWQFGLRHLFKISVHHFGVATALEY